MTTNFRSVLTSDQQVPPSGSIATGSAVLSLNEAGDALSYRLSTSGLDFRPILGLVNQTGNPGDDVTRVHFHTGARGVNGPLAFEFLARQGNGQLLRDNDLVVLVNANGLVTMTGMWTLSDPADQPLGNFIQALRSTTPDADTNLYLHIHTNQFPNGEIRGQVVGSSIADPIVPLTGTSANDTLVGGAASNTLMGFAGEDLILGNEGDDLLFGNQNNDTLLGGTGQDTIYGGKDDDLIFGNQDNDVLLGDLGNDTLFGGKDNDLVFGNQGNDVLFGDLGNDSLYGGKQDDSLIGGSGNDYLSGDLGNDTLIGVNPNDANPGRGEIDTLVGGEGSDRFILGDATKTYYVSDALPGLNDYALIVDFDPTQDIIQLRGAASDYGLVASPQGLPSGTAIFGPNRDELIAIIQGASNLTLQSSSFVFV